MYRFPLRGLNSYLSHLKKTMWSQFFPFPENGLDASPQRVCLETCSCLMGKSPVPADLTTTTPSHQRPFRWRSPISCDVLKERCCLSSPGCRSTAGLKREGMCCQSLPDPCFKDFLNSNVNARITSLHLPPGDRTTSPC